MTAPPFELGAIHDPVIRRAFEQIRLQWPADVGGGGGAPTGPAGGVLGGTYPNPGFAADMATQAELDAHTGLTTTAHGGIVASTDPRLTDSRAPNGAAGGALTGTYPNPGLANLIVVDANVSATAAIAESKLNLATDAAAGVGSRRTLGTGALQATAGNDARLSNARTPTAHAASHISGAADSLTGNLDAVGRTNVKKAGTTIGTRRGLNLIQGTNITLTVADDAVNEEVDVTITAAGGGGTTVVWGRVNSTGTIAAGTGFTITKGATGIYTITFSALAPSAVVGNSWNLADQDIFTTDTYTATTVRVVMVHGGTGATVDRGFTFHAV